MIKAIYAVCFIFLTAACVPSLESDAPAKIRYVLHPYSADATTTAQATNAIILRVLAPTIAEGLDTDKIATLEDNRRLYYLSQARWTGPLSDVILRFLIDSTGSTATITSITQDSYRLRPHYQLHTDITAMQAEYHGEAGSGIPIVRTSIRFIITDYDGDNIVKTLHYHDTRSAADNSATAITSTIEAQLHEAVAQAINAVPITTK